MATNVCTNAEQHVSHAAIKLLEALHFHRFTSQVAAMKARAFEAGAFFAYATACSASPTDVSIPDVCREALDVPAIRESYVAGYDSAAKDVGPAAFTGTCEHGRANGWGCCDENGRAL